MSEATGMTLRSAIYVVTKEHTGHDPRVGVTVQARIRQLFCEFSDTEYLEAWRVLRRYLGLPSEREPTNVRS